ncbi:MAG: aldolase/citrate lyase family protein [Salinivirgaceae bacterium]|jgi:(3S)-malyl-CoA thioesterase|nr:aldolase/citrate lyase family protein [Salinivirgaceae bacterium]
MLKTYFFIPATRKKFIDKMPFIDADEFVFDLEDAIAENDSESAFENLQNIENRDQYIVRPRLYTSSGKLMNNKLEKLIDMGFHRFFIPKTDTPAMLDDLLNVFNYYEIDNLEWYYLIESPAALMNIKEMALSGKYPLKGICLGSQDYAAEMGMSYSLETISWARHYVLNVAKACKIEAIDMASMVLKDRKLFETECHQSFRMGYDSKLVVHPAQLEVLHDLDYYSKEEIEQAQYINEKVNLSELKNFSVITVDGLLYERPHINRVKKILNYIKKHENK